MGPLIQLDHIYKIYNQGDNEVRALEDVSITIMDGEFTAIIGHSGSGKSTMMNILGCLDVPTSGEYLLAGEKVSDMDDDRLSRIRGRQIGFIFQGFNLIPSLDAMENVELPLIYRKVPREERRRMARESLCRVGLQHRLHHRPGQMSGGQQQRVAIARAIAARPPILLADEPPATWIPAPARRSWRSSGVCIRRVTPSSSSPTTGRSPPASPGPSACWTAGWWRTPLPGWDDAAPPGAG